MGVTYRLTPALRPHIGGKAVTSTGNQYSVLRQAYPCKRCTFFFASFQLLYWSLATEHREDEDQCPTAVRMPDHLLHAFCAGRKRYVSVSQLPKAPDSKYVQLRCDSIRPSCGNCAAKGVYCETVPLQHKPRFVLATSC